VSIDLSLPLVDEKAALPAIIVTPSSPAGEKDFSIAFLAEKPPPTLRERICERLPTMPKVPSFFRRRLPSQIKLPVSPMHNTFDQSTAPWSFKGRACTTILSAVLIFILGCHLLLHSLIVYHPRLNYGSVGEESMLGAVTAGNLDSLGSLESNAGDSTSPSVGGWFYLHSLWAPVATIDDKRNPHFIISEEDYDKIQIDST
jgi:hypothetical protein